MKDLLIFKGWSLLMQIVALATAYWLGGERGVAATVLLSMAFATLLATFQHKRRLALCYASSAVLMLAAFVAPPLLALWLVMLIMLVRPLHASTPRNIMAMLLGLLTPLWMALPLVALACWQYDMLARLQAHWQETIALSEPLRLDAVGEVEVTVYVLLLVVLMALSIAHVANVKTVHKYMRAQHAAYMLLAWIVVLVIPCFPLMRGYSMPLLISCIGPLLAYRLWRERR